jgi:hypothetical protein
MSFSTTSGTVATRFSPAAVSFGTPIRMGISSPTPRLNGACAGPPKHRRAHMARVNVREAYRISPLLPLVTELRVKPGLTQTKIAEAVE